VYRPCSCGCRAIGAGGVMDLLRLVRLLLRCRLIVALLEGSGAVDLGSEVSNEEVLLWPQASPHIPGTFVHRMRRARHMRSNAVPVWRRLQQANDSSQSESR
jgi:hypothetical protein